MLFNLSVLVFCVLFIFLAHRRLDWSLYLIVAFLPSYLIRFTVLGLPATLLEAMILIAFLVFLIKYKFFWVGDFRQHAFFWPIVAILITAVISLIISPDFIRAAGIFKAYFIEPLLFYIILISTIKTKEQLKNVFWALGLSALYLSLISFWQYFSGWNVPEAFMNKTGGVDRVVSIFGYPNALGLYLGPIIILFVGFLLWSRDKISQQILKLTVILFSFTTIILAQSEAAILSVLGVLFLWGLIYPVKSQSKIEKLKNKKTGNFLLSQNFQQQYLTGVLKKTRYYFLILTIGLVLIFILVSPVNSYLSEKILLQDYSGFIRRLIWGESLNMLKDNWFFGAGLAGYQIKIIPYHLKTFEIFLYPHNIVLNFWSELGLLGLLSFVWLFGKFFYANLKNRRNLLSLTLLLITVQIVIHGLVDAPYFKNDLAVLFWLIIGIGIINKDYLN